MDKIKIFEDELNLIKDKDIRKFVEDFLEKVPEYFLQQPLLAQENIILNTH